VQAASTVALLLLHCVKFAIANCKNQFTASNHLLGLIIIRSVSLLMLGKQDPDTHTHTCLTALFSVTTRVSRYQKRITNLDFSAAGDGEW